jgi:hypothetical protein
MRSIRAVRRSSGGPDGVIRLLGLAAVIAVLAVAATACGSDSDSSGVAQAGDGGADSTTTTGTGTTPVAAGGAEQAQLDFAQCMRDEGLDFDDPRPDANGNLQFQPPTGDFDQAAFQDGLEVCQDLLAGAGSVLPDTDSTEFQDAQLEFARCMRDEGVDFPDPQPGQGLGARAGQIDTDDPTTAAAIETCQPLIAGVLPGGGGQ